ncbi:DUF4435 domain-containing protein [Shewanella xiamenensis]|uniref:DUF4435 domain-containing protein n=1 Tax=Shewanella xiamenensis TaxID=332186 RepID=UPI001185164D|nr:DUF4435 domain-containing protein [Shewanella xiamenensis]TVL34506.1 hypothetical protein AYI95_03785 [Shewanella xiamenensis]
MTTVSSGISFGVTSEYVEAVTRQFDSSQEPILYVEGWPDVNFWHAIFRAENLIVDAKPYGQDSNSNGKPHLIANIRNDTIKLGPYLMVAMDSDYDYLLDLNSDIYVSEFVFQTYAYSIENLLWHPNKLVELCQKASNTRNVPPNIPDVIKEWSKAIYPEFVRILKDEHEKQEKIRVLTELLKPDLSFDYSNLDVVAQTVVDSDLFNDKGLTKVNVNLFVRGHDYEVVAKKICDHVVNGVLRDMICDFNSRYGDKAGEKITEYVKSRKKIVDFIMFEDVDCPICTPLIKKDILLLKNNYYKNK